MALLWAPLSLGDFVSAAQQQQYVSLKKWLGTTCSTMLARASPEIEATLAYCNAHGCSATSCPLHTGCVLFTAQTLVQTGNTEADVTMEWRNILSLAEFHRHKLLDAVLTYNRMSEVCVMVLIPSDILAPLMTPEALPAVGVFGVGAVPLADLGKTLVHVCFQEAVENLPPGVVKIEPDMLQVDPTDPSKLPILHVTGLDAAMHGALPSMPWGSQTSYAWPVPKTVLNIMQPDMQQTTAQAEQQTETAVLGGADDMDEAQPGVDVSVDHISSVLGMNARLCDAPNQEVRAELTESALVKLAEQQQQQQMPVVDAVPLITPFAVPLTPSQQRVYLQATINKFWMTVGDMAQRLTNRVWKIRCRERIACDGIECVWCRGAMVFTATALEGPGGQAWRYLCQGAERMSNTPKQYIRGEWRTVYEMVEKLGSLDVELIRTAARHDRRKGYLQALCIPRHLVAECVPHAPPCGLLFWRLAPHADPHIPALPIGTTAPLSPLTGPITGSNATTTTPPGALSVFNRGPAGATLAPIKSEYSYTSAEEEPLQDAGVGAGAGALSPGARCCEVQGCAVVEERYTGVALMICSGCKGAAYCTAEHQRMHWRVHKKQCGTVTAAQGAQ